MSSTVVRSTAVLCDTLADDVLQNIHNREALIERLQKLHRESVVSRDIRIQRLLYGIHNASLAVVESITAWNQFKQQAWYRKKTIELHNASLNSPHSDSIGYISERCPFNTFVWNGQNYLRKMLSDVDFAGDILEALNFLGPSTSFHRNPFLLPLNVDELALCHRDESYQSSNIAKKMSRISWKDVVIERVQQASFILLLDEFHRELDLSNGKLSSIDETTSYATYRCRDETHTIKFYPPDLKHEKIADVTTALDPPATSVIAICCASLVLNSVDADIMNKLLFLTKPIARKILKQPISRLIDRARSYNPLQKIDPKIINIVYPFMMHEKMNPDFMVDTPESIVLLITWLRGVLTRGYDESINSRSCGVEKVFSELDYKNDRRQKSGGVNKRKAPGDEYNKENHTGTNQRNVSVQVQTEEINEANQKNTGYDTPQALNDFLDDPKSIKLVPFPIAITVNVTEGSQTVIVNGDVSETSSIEPCDVVRISDPYESSDWKILTSPCKEGDGTIKFKLTASYDHSKIVAQEKKTKDDAIYRLCYGKDRTPSPDRALSSIDPNEHHDVASDQLSSTRSHLYIKQARIWKLIPENKDSRPPWRKEYDDEMVPWIEDYADSTKHANLFRVKTKMESIEQSCRDSPYLHCVHQQRVKFFENVSLTKVIDEAFHAVCRWHPKGSLVDNVKWAKLSRKMRFMSNIKNSKHEIDMAFLRHNQDRKLDLAKFHSILEDIASMQYPALPIDVSWFIFFV